MREALGEYHTCSTCGHTHTHTHTSYLSILSKNGLPRADSPACPGILGLPWALELPECPASLGSPCHLSAHRARGGLEAPWVPDALAGDTDTHLRWEGGLTYKCHWSVLLTATQMPPTVHSDISSPEDIQELLEGRLSQQAVSAAISTPVSESSVPWALCSGWLSRCAAALLGGTEGHAGFNPPLRVALVVQSFP